MMLLHNTVYIIRTDEGYFIVVNLEKARDLSIPDHADDPLEYYHVNGRKIAMQLMSYYGAGYKRTLKVFKDYQSALEYLPKVGIMNETDTTK